MPNGTLPHRSTSRIQVKTRTRKERLACHPRCRVTRKVGPRIAVRKRNGRVDVLLIQVKRRQPPKKPIATFYRNCSVLDCFVFFAPRKGPFLSKDWRFSVSDLSSIVRQLLGEQRATSCAQQRERTKLCRRDCRSGSTHTRRRRACSRSTESSDHQELQRGRSDGSDQKLQGQ
jgi:hypothetical protein